VSASFQSARSGAFHFGMIGSLLRRTTKGLTPEQGPRRMVLVSGRHLAWREAKCPTILPRAVSRRGVAQN
jgi:hypothetical protein